MGLCREDPAPPSFSTRLLTSALWAQIILCCGAFTHDMPVEPLQLGQPKCLQTVPSTLYP